MSAIVRRESPISVRTIFLAVHPPPATLSERRAVFRVLRQHGAFHVFKKLNVRAPVVSVRSSRPVHVILRRGPRTLPPSSPSLPTTQPPSP